MSRSFSSLLARALTFLALSLPVAARAGAPATPDDRAALPDLVARLLPAVVNISVLKQPARPDGSMAEGSVEMLPPKREVGSGFVIEPEGYVLTNRHVVAGAYKVTVVMADETSYPAEVVSTNERPDLALLKIDAGHLLQAVEWGDSDTVRMGETAIAIGNPLGLSSSITVGVVSALNRDLDETQIDDFIQTDAAINHGNSGGPLFNIQGQVIGINTQLISPTDTGGSIGLGLSIPSNDAKFIVGEMHQYGRFKAGYLGVRLQQITPEIAATVGLDDSTGGIVSALAPGGPAEQAGIRDGDIVLQFGARKTHDIRALLREIGRQLPGSTQTVRLWRDRHEQTVDVVLGGWTNNLGLDPAGTDPMPPRGPRITSETLGMRVADLTPELRTQFKLPDSMNGVIVLGVAANSLGADTGFARGDVVQEVENHKVTTMREIRDDVTAARAQGRARVLMLVSTNNRPHWLAVPTSDQ